VAIYTEPIKRIKESYPKMMEIMNKVKPDAVVVDDVIHNPASVDLYFCWKIISDPSIIIIIIMFRFIY